MNVTFIAMLLGSLNLLSLWFCRYRIKKTYDQIDGLLERVLKKDPTLREESMGENRLSKLSHKAVRILESYVLEARQLQDDKNTIQGFISDMSHQMKTPLAGILMYADLLLEGPAEPDELEEFLCRIKNSTEKLQWMMDNLIKMSRLEIDAIQLSPVHAPIEKTLSDAIESVEGERKKKDILFEVGNLPQLMLSHDPKWTREAVANILENAIKYSFPGGKVFIEIEKFALHSRILVKNKGAILEKNELPFIFKRFYRGRHVKNQEGAGLGLYLAQLILKKQGGYLMAEVEPGGVNSFSIFLQNERAKD